MLAVCDGGSTKADWLVCLNDGTNSAVTTTGFNPNYDPEERITGIIQQELVANLPNAQPGRVFYYGTGCWAPEKKAIVKNALSNAFPQSLIEVNSDLLAAARATCGQRPGIACILGTGSNSVLYDGEKEIDNVTNLGFLLGDEGSGSMIGKRLVQAYFYREMPTEFHPVMEKMCPNGRKDVLDKVYGGGVPAAYLASFVPAFADHQNHYFIRHLVKDCFVEFLVRHVCKYENHDKLPVHFVGSIAWHFQEILLETLRELQLHPGIILRRPIENLLKYHLQKEQ